MKITGLQTAIASAKHQALDLMNYISQPVYTNKIKVDEKGDLQFTNLDKSNGKFLGVNKA